MFSVAVSGFRAEHDCTECSLERLALRGVDHADVGDHALQPRLEHGLVVAILCGEAFGFCVMQNRAQAPDQPQTCGAKVAQRKKTQIIFLGRGVSAGLADTKANIEKLQTAQMPILAHPMDVAEAMKIPLSQLR